MIDYETPRYESRLVARAAKMPLPTFRSYLSRGQFRIIGDAEERATAGLAHKFSLRDALGFAVAAALIRAGADPKKAFEAGMIQFAHTATAGHDGHERLPGHVFDERECGGTYMLFFPESGAARILSEVGGHLVTESLLKDPLTGETDIPMLARINPIRLQVFEALGIDPRSEQAAA